jgi:uncharacterized protein (DUF362 family)
MNKKHPQVAVSRVKQIDKSVREVIDAVQGFNQLKKGDSVVIKPNICRCVDPDGHINTDSRVLQSVIQYTKEFTSNIRVCESDSSKGTSTYRMLYSGTLDIIEQEGVSFLDLSKDKQVEVTHFGVTDEVSKTAMEASLFINIPKIKTHEDTLLTCAAKNMFGFLSRGDKWTHIHEQDQLDPYIIFSALTIPKQLIVVDGILGMEGAGPIGGSPVSLNMVLGGTDVVSTDAVVCNLVGLNPKKITHLVDLEKQGIGTLNLKKIHLHGEKLKTARHPIKKPEEAPLEDRDIYKDEHPYWACAMDEAERKYRSRLEKLQPDSKA